MLKRLYIDNWRCFVNFEMAVDPVMLVMGGNGVGKSALFELLRRLRDFATGQVECHTAFDTDSLNWWKSSVHQRIELEVELDQGTFVYTLAVEHQPERRTSAVAAERLSLDGEPLFAFETGQLTVGSDSGARGSSVQLTASRSGLSYLEPRDNTSFLAFRNWMQSMVALRLNPFAMSPLTVREESQLASDGANFASWYRALVLEKPTAAARLAEILQPMVPGLAGIAFERAGRARSLQFQLTSPPDGNGPSQTVCEFDRLSDGQRALTVLYAIQQLCSSGGDRVLVCLDEPDNFLALGEIQPWLVEMRTAAEDGGCQLLVSSHHPELINYLAPEFAVVLLRDDAGPSRHQRFEYRGEQPLTPAELVARGWAFDA